MKEEKRRVDKIKSSFIAKISLKKMTSQNLEPVCCASNATCSRQKSSHRINSALVRNDLPELGTSLLCLKRNVFETEEFPSHQLRARPKWPPRTWNQFAMPQTHRVRDRRVPIASTPRSSEMTSQNLEPVCYASNAPCSRQKSSHRINSVHVRSVVEKFRNFFFWLVKTFRKHLKEFLLQTKMMCAIIERQASEEKRKARKIFLSSFLFQKKKI